MNINRLTQRLQRLEEEAGIVSATTLATPGFVFAGGQYTIRVANDLESRKKAYELVYRLYLEKEYARPHPSKMWLSIFDALPETVTLLVERQESAIDFRLSAIGQNSGDRKPKAESPKPPVPVGALTVVFDSPMGLPADELYKPELDALRASGRRLAEIVSLGVAEEAGAGSQVLVKLFNFAYFIARGIREATDFVVTVNPRHVRFYERLMRFAEAGPEREYGKVGGATAVLLRLDFDVAEAQRRAAIGVRCPAIGSRSEGPRPIAESRHSIYNQFHAVGEEPETVAALAAQLRPMSGREIGYFFVAETDLLARATPEQRVSVQEQHRAYESVGAAGGVFSLK